jgi:hypothetical protein
MSLITHQSAWRRLPRSSNPGTIGAFQLWRESIRVADQEFLTKVALINSDVCLLIGVGTLHPSGNVKHKLSRMRGLKHGPHLPARKSSTSTVDLAPDAAAFG